MSQTEKITKAVLYGSDTEGNEIKISFPNISNASIETIVDDGANISLSALPYKNNTIFTIEKKEKKEGEKVVNGSLIYCRFSNCKCEFNLNTKVYAYYMPITPENLQIGIGTVFIPIDNWGKPMYIGTHLRCERILCVESLQDAEFLADKKLKTINRINVIKHSNLYHNGKSCSFNPCDKYYTYDGTTYSAEQFWKNVVCYDTNADNKHENPFVFISSKDKDKHYIKENNKGEDIMEKKNIFGNIFKNMKFGKIEDSGIKYSFNGIAFETRTNGEYVVYNDDFTFTNVSNMVIDIPVFAMPVAKKDIKKGDIILHNGSYVIVNAVADNEINVARPWNKEIVSIIPEKSIFGFSYYTKIINPFDGFGSTADEKNPFGNIMPFLLLSDNKDNSMNDMITMMMLCGGNIDMTNPLMMYAMMGNDNINPLMLLAMSGNNPFASMTNKTTE